MHAIYCKFTLYFDYNSWLLSWNLAATWVENFGGDLELKRLDLTWSSQVDLTAATLRSTWAADVCYRAAFLLSLGRFLQSQWAGFSQLSSPHKCNTTAIQEKNSCIAVVLRLYRLCRQGRMESDFKGNGPPIWAPGFARAASLAPLVLAYSL